MWNTASIALGELHQNDRMVMKVMGFANYDEDASRLQGALDILDVDIMTSINKSGIGISTTFKWLGDAEIGLGVLVPSVPLVNSSTGHVTFPPETTQYPYAGDGTKDFDASGALSVNIYPDAADCVIACSNIGPVSRMYEQAISPKTKLYCELDTALMPGGNTPADGDIWVTGGTISVRALPNSGTGSRYRARYA